jgi:hypothetical protein
VISEGIGEGGLTTATTEGQYANGRKKLSRQVRGAARTPKKEAMPRDCQHGVIATFPA